jgi:hypothetical protein
MPNNDIGVDGLIKLVVWGIIISITLLIVVMLVYTLFPLP